MLYMKEIVLYYQVHPLQNVISTESSYAKLFTDLECTNVAGYYSIEKQKNIIQLADNLYNVNATLYFGERIVKYTYVRKNEISINAPILFDNLWNGKTPVGYVHREILQDGITRKVTVYLS